jgi:plastocyanin
VRAGRVLLLAAFGVGVLSGCGETGEPLELVEGVRVDVVAVDNEFEPTELEVAAGTEVQFVNQGRNEHNVIPIGEERDAIRVDTEDLEPDDTAVRRLRRPGIYEYYCSIHGTPTAGMIGTITVTRGDN